MNAESWTSEELEKLRKSMPEDGKKTLAKHFDLSEGRIGNILRGQKPNSLVLLKAAELANDHQRKIKAAREAIAEL